MKKLFLTTILLTLFFAAAQNISAQRDAKKSEAQIIKFDDALRHDFEKGAAGDAAALERAMRTVERALKSGEKVLENDPKNAEALVWHGSATLVLAGRAFQAGNFEQGGELWEKGLSEMDAAVKIAPDDAPVLVVRGSTLLEVSKHFPVPEEVARLLRLGIGDYEKIIALAGDKFAEKPEGARARLLYGLAEGYARAGDVAKARRFYERLAGDATTDKRREKAVKWLAENKTQ